MQTWKQGCKASTGVELDSIQGGMHLPSIGDTFRQQVFDFLIAHPKP